MAHGHGSPRRLRGIASLATRHLLDELLPAYERRTGQPVDLVAVGGVDAARRVASGERFDFVVLAAEAIDRLAASGRVDPASVVGVARAGIAVAVRAGTAAIDLASEAAVRDLVLGAARIGYSTGPSGTYLLQLFDAWGVRDALAARLVQAPPGVPVATLVANGDVQIGFQQLSELVHAVGITVAGPLPDAIQRTTLFSAGVCTTSPSSATAALLAFLASPDVDAVRRRHGLDPPR